jgi:ketosteroid isomerase-like protein
MRRTTAFLLAVPAFVVSLAIGAAAMPGDEAKHVMDVTQQACDAFRTTDLPAIEKLLAPDFTLVGSDATVQSRSDVIAEVRSGDPQYEVFRNHSMTARVYGDAAVVQGITSLKGTSGGEAFELDVRFSDTLVRADGRWQLVVSHVTRIPSR